MTKPNEKLVEFPSPSSRDVLTDVLREGARRVLATVIEAEVADYVAAREAVVDAPGHRRVVRTGYLPERPIQTPLGDIRVQQPRGRDRRPVEERETFRSAILPPSLRRTASLEALYPWLYLKGVSTGDFGEALQALLGPEARGRSPTTITRLKTVWEQEYATWAKRSLADRRYIYVWADGVYFNVRLEDTDNKRQCILVLMGATRDGKKELIAITDGYRESEQSWRELLLAVQDRGLTIDPQLATGDGGLRLLGRGAQGLPEDPGTALLGPQDGERAEQAPKGRAAQSQSHAARHLDGGNQGRGRASVRPVPGDVRRQVPRGDYVPHQGPGTCS